MQEEAGENSVNVPSVTGFRFRLSPDCHRVSIEQVRKLYLVGVSKSEIARRLHIGRTSVRRILAIHPKDRTD
jgi:DNA invertase Pin-like site-specific DNA recombinase